MTGFEGPVLATKQLYVRGDYQESDLPESAYSSPFFSLLIITYFN
jgi:hypothetical protein